MHRLLSPTHWRWLIALLLLCLLTPAVANESNLVRYPRRADGDEFRSIYALAQLQLALDKAGSALRLHPSRYSMEQERALVNLEHNRHLDVAWSMTSVEREQRLLPVRIPLDKGVGIALGTVPVAAHHLRAAHRQFARFTFGGEAGASPCCHLTAHNFSRVLKTYRTCASLSPAKAMTGLMQKFCVATACQ